MKILSVNKDLKKVVFLHNGKKVIADYFIRGLKDQSAYIFSHKLPTSKVYYYAAIYSQYTGKKEVYPYFARVMKCDDNKHTEDKVDIVYFRDYKTARNFVLNEVLSKTYNPLFRQ